MLLRDTTLRAWLPASAQDLILVIELSSALHDCLQVQQFTHEMYCNMNTLDMYLRLTHGVLLIQERQKSERVDACLC